MTTADTQPLPAEVRHVVEEAAASAAAKEMAETTEEARWRKQLAKRLIATKARVNSFGSRDYARGRRCRMTTLFGYRPGRGA